MPSRCVVGNCRNYANWRNSLHSFPKDEKRNRKWREFVESTKKDFPVLLFKHSMICSAHFTDECFASVWQAYHSNRGIYRRLKGDAVPTIKYPGMLEKLGELRAKMMENAAPMQRDTGPTQKVNTMAGQQANPDLGQKVIASITEQSSSSLVQKINTASAQELNSTTSQQSSQTPTLSLARTNRTQRANTGPVQQVNASTTQRSNVIAQRVDAAGLMKKINCTAAEQLKNGPAQTVKVKIENISTAQPVNFFPLDSIRAEHAGTSKAQPLNPATTQKSNVVPTKLHPSLVRQLGLLNKLHTVEQLNHSLAQALKASQTPVIHESSSQQENNSPAQEPKRRARMPRCSIPGCRMQNTSTHYFPKDKARCSEWVKFVQEYRPNFRLSQWSCICGAHFEMDCFTHNFVLEKKMGCNRLRRNLTDEAIPTIFDIKATDESHTAAVKPPELSPDAAKNLLTSLPPITKPVSNIRKIAPKLDPRSPQSNVLLKGKLFGPFSSSQAPLILLPQGTSLSTTVSGTTASTTNLALALPVSINSNMKTTQKHVVKTAIPPAKTPAPSTMHQKQILVRKKFVPKTSIVPTNETSTAARKRSTFSLQQLKRMSSEDLVTLFSIKVKIDNSKNYALRCKMGGNCPFVISCPSEYDCKSVMNLHLKKHIDWWTVGTEGNSLIASQLNFESVLAVGENSSSEEPTQLIQGSPRPKIDNVPCIAEAQANAIPKNEVLQTAFQKLCETIATEMNQIKVERERIEALLQDEAEHDSKEIHHFNAATQSPRKHLIPEDKLKLLNLKEKSAQAAQTVNLMLQPLSRLMNPPLILARSRKKFAPIEEPGMPVITGIRGSVQREDESKEFQPFIDNIKNLSRPRPLGLANEMIAKAKAVFDRISPSVMGVDTENIVLRDSTSESSAELHKSTITKTKLADLANQVLQSEFDNQPPSVESSSENFEEFDIQENVELESTPLVDDDIDDQVGDDEMRDLTDAEKMEEIANSSELEIIGVHSPARSCRKKEIFLAMLGLRNTTMVKEKENVPFVANPIFRTRQQKKVAVLQKFYKKLHAEMVPKRVEVKLTDVKIEPPDEISECVFGNQIPEEKSDTESEPEMEPEKSLRDSSPRQSVHISLSEKLKMPGRMNLHQGFENLQDYQVRRADLLKKRAHEQTKLSNIRVKDEFVPPEITETEQEFVPREIDKMEWDADDEEAYFDDYSESAAEPYNRDGRILKMPEEAMLEVYKDDQKLIRELEEEAAERKMSRQIKVLRMRRERLQEERLKKEEDERQKVEMLRNSTPLCDLIPSDKLVLKRKCTVIPRRGAKNDTDKETKKDQRSSWEIVVNGKTVTIKREAAAMSDGDEDGGHDSDVESFEEGGYSSEEEGQREKKAKLSVPELLSRQRRSIALLNEPETPRKDDEYDSTDSEEDKKDDSATDSLDEEDLDLDLDPVEGGFEENGAADISAERMDMGEEKSASLVVKEAVDRHGGTSSSHQHPVGRKKRRPEELLTSQRRANFAPPSALTETELRVRERALEYLKRLKILERERNRMEENGQAPPEKTSLFTCKICDRRFVGLNTMFYHYRSHAGVKPFKCDICFKTFTRLHSLNYHKMIHADKTRFQCRFCGKGFRHPSHYKEHLNVHTGAEPFKCRECSKGFRTSNSLRRHLRKEHGLTITVRIGDHMPTIEELERADLRPSSPPPQVEKMQCNSPPLPDSPKEPDLVPSEPSNLPDMHPIKLTLFPKNGLSRVCFADDTSKEEK